MEIKCVKKEKIEYPKINEISNRRVKYDIPDKWVKLGITSFVFNILMQGKVFAIADDSARIVDIIRNTEINVVEAGSAQYYHPIYMYVVGGCAIVSLMSALSFVISAIMIIYKKIKAKRQGKEIKISKTLKIILTISIILFILSLIVNYLKY